ncbi:MAG: MqnA/MqnD/SBP family protein [Campylobacterales bacterium]
MIFGKIDYLNLLPFHVFLKKQPFHSRFKASAEWKKSYPSFINTLLEHRKVDAGFISSIKSSGKNCFDAGIVAQNEVLSVIVIDKESGEDIESETSNALSKILGLQGRVLIGDKALKRYLEDSSNIQDMAKIWREKEGLPFVFARFCACRHIHIYGDIAKKFVTKRVKIPSYILKKYAKSRDITPQQLLLYLSKISYKIEHKEKKALKKYLKLAKKVK